MPALAMPSAPVPEGHGRVVLDTTDGPMDVVARTDAAFVASAEVPSRSGFLCRTPCVVDLPIGAYTLYFSGLEGDAARGDVTRLEVRDGLNVLRRSPGKYQAPEDANALGVTLAVLGSTMLGIGIALAVSTEEVPAGVGLSIGGTAGTVGGIALAMPKRAEQQEGATSAWNVPAQPVSPPHLEAPFETQPPLTGSHAP